MTEPQSESLAEAEPETLLGDVVDRAHLVVTCGPGGVGKTTTAASLALAAARHGRRVVVVTVDPARRLADALGIESTSHEPVEVIGATESAPVPGGSLWALMLDAAHTFDELVRSEAGDAARAEAILRNPVYRSITGALAGAQEYMAIERLHQLHTTGDFDLVVVDTPPSRHALDLLEAPDRLTTFLGHPIYRTLTAPTRAFARVTNAASSAFIWTVRKLAGPSIVEDTLQFFRAISGMEDGLRRRASEVADLLHDERTAFVVVSSPREEAIAESTFLLDGLAAGGFDVGGVVVNLVHPTPTPLEDPPEVGPGPLADLLAHHADLSALAASERAEIDTLIEVAGGRNPGDRRSGTGVAVVEVPFLDEDVHDLDGLAVVAGWLLGRSG